MRFLADESCDFRVIRALRAAGHDVSAMIEIALGAEDELIIELAAREARVFVTEDRDFGQLTYAAATPARGVIMIRFPSNARRGLPAMLVDIAAQYGEKLAGSFVVVEPGRIRFGRIPEA
jgi:predicted nuclease of predicted toxin-antitoxin system